MNLARLRALLSDRYVLDGELRAAIAEQGPTPHLLGRLRVNRADVLSLREEIDRQEHGQRVAVVELGVAA